MERSISRTSHDQRDTRSALWAGALLFSIGPAAMMVMPMIVGVYVDELGFSGRQAGLLASVEATGMCVASLLGMVWVNAELACRHTAGTGCAVAANLRRPGSTSSHRCWPAARWPVSVPERVCRATASLASESRRRRSARVMVQTPLTTVMMALSAGDHRVWPCRDLPDAGVAGLVVALPVGLPARSAKSAPVGEPAPRPGSTHGAPIVAGLIGTLLFYAGVLGFWVYLERIRHAAGHSNALIGTILAGSLGARVLGGIGPVWISGRVGIARPILLTVLILIATVLMTVGKLTLPVFALSAIVFGAMWVFATAYQAALIATLDRYGRYVVLVPAAQGAGAMIDRLRLRCCPG